MMGIPGHRMRLSPVLLCALLLLVLAVAVEASVGDRLPEFNECVEVCKRENCNSDDPTPIPLHRRLLFWSCPSECDYTCQHIITASRVASIPPLPVVQFHGKWPFHRLLGMQEPASVLFSLGNLWAHVRGRALIRSRIPPSYPLRPWYDALAYVGMAAWVLSAVFHTRDFPATEELDYFGAGATVLYGMYYTVVRIYRLDTPPGADGGRRRSALRAWSLLCALLYVAHVAYLKGVTWDYTYNMAANVVVGMVQNVLWIWFSWARYRETRQSWAVWPGVVVVCVMAVMSLELFDFAPLWGTLDAHSLWHLGTIGPSMLLYHFIIKDAQDDMTRSARLKQ